MATIRAPRDVADADGKRQISRKVAHIGQGLKRNGQDHVGVTVFEKEKGDLHGHHLFFAEQKNFGLVDGWCEGKGGAIHIRPADATAVDYVIKQRLHQKPEFERDLREKRLKYWKPVKGELIEGPRVSLTRHAARLLETVKPVTVAVEAKAPWVPFESLFAELPEAQAPEPIAKPLPRQRLKQSVRHTGQVPMLFIIDGGISDRLRQLGRTSSEIAAKLGVSPVHARALRNGQYGPSSEVARKILELTAA
jgi:hypothetical protein